VKLSEYAKKLGVHYRTVWNYFKKGLIPGAFKLPSGTIIVPDDSVSSFQDRKIDNRFKNKDPISVTHQSLVKEWHPTKNSSSPCDLTAGSSKKVWWICAFGHVWEARISTRTNALPGRSKPLGCPFCSNRQINAENSLSAVNPILSKEWHPTKNSFKPDEVSPSSGKKVWWKCQNGHE